MPTTYEPIATTTLTSTTRYITFSSIPSSYTDLVLVGFGKNTVAGDNLVYKLNGATSGYSTTRIYGSGSAASSTRWTTSVPVSLVGFVGTEWGNFITHFMNYSNTTTYKTHLTRCNYANDGVAAAVSLYQSTSAISSIEISMSDQSFASGSTFTLYGIKAA
jgi:hypothetical protein